MTERIGVPAGIAELLDALDAHYPGYTFSVTPLMVTPDLIPYRELMVRHLSGKLIKLHTQIQPEALYDDDSSLDKMAKLIHEEMLMEMK